MIRSVLVSMVASWEKSNRPAQRGHFYALVLNAEDGSSAPCFQLFLPVTSSHFSPRSFLIASTFFDASSFIATKLARAAA